MALDIFCDDAGSSQPVVVYAHGFNGFKDWGNFDLVAEKFVKAGFTCIKFNFSHNGTCPAAPTDFVDLEAFAQNNYSIELFDLDAIIDWIYNPQNKHGVFLNNSQLSLVGHSMGGGIVLLHAASDKRVSKVVSWAGISECKTPWSSWPPAKMREWKERGVQYYLNSRTGQHMPLYYQLYEDYTLNADKLNIQKAIASLKIPVLLCHGTTDTAVPIEKAKDLKRWQPAAELFIVESDHVFGRRHPWTDPELPQAMNEVVDETIRFLQ